jgi:hypothetical protein
MCHGKYLHQLVSKIDKQWNTNKPEDTLWGMKHQFSCPNEAQLMHGGFAPFRGDAAFKKWYHHWQDDQWKHTNGDHTCDTCIARSKKLLLKSHECSSTIRYNDQ